MLESATPSRMELNTRMRKDVDIISSSLLCWDVQEHLDDMVARAGKREHLSYGEWANSVYNALASVDIAGQRGLVVGRHHA